MATEPKRGRKTKEEEAREYLLSIGLDPDELIPSESTPIDPQKMVEAFTRKLYTAMNRDELKGTALVQGLKAVGVLAESARNQGSEDDGPERGIDDILADAGLPRERKLEIGRQELERLHARAAALQLLVERIEHDGQP